MSPENDTAHYREMYTTCLLLIFHQRKGNEIKLIICQWIIKIVYMEHHSAEEKNKNLQENRWTQNV